MVEIGRLAVDEVAETGDLVLDGGVRFGDLALLLEADRLVLVLEGAAEVAALGGGLFPAAGRGGELGGGVLHAALRVAVAGIDGEDPLIGLDGAGEVLELHAEHGELVEIVLIVGPLVGDGLVGQDTDLRDVERLGGLGQDFVGLGVIGVEGEHLLGGGHGAGGIFFDEIPRLHRAGGGLDRVELLADRRLALVLVDLDGAEDLAGFQQGRLDLEHALQEGDGVVPVVGIGGGLAAFP